MSKVSTYRVYDVVAPSVSDDYTKGFFPGCEWFNMTTNILYINKGVTIGAAVWVESGLPSSVSVLQFSPGATPSVHTEGKVYWDSTDHTLCLMSEITGSILQLGQENWVRAVNKTGSVISNGSVVYLSGAQGNRPTVSLAIASSVSSDATIGLATNDIANNAEGYVTTFGIVRGVNTSAFTAGDTLWLSASVNGGIVNVKPSSPNAAVRIGYALNSTNDGSILVSVDVGGVIAAHTHTASQISDSTAIGRALLTAGSVTAQQNALGVAPARNLLHNTQFKINQIGYAGGSVSRGARTYDRWRWYSYTQGSLSLSGKTATVSTSGEVAQVIYAEDLPSASIGEFITLVASNSGTAQLYIGGTPVSNGGTIAVVPGTNVIVSFGPGTILDPIVAIGTVLPAVEHKPYAIDLAQCQRHFYRLYSGDSYPNTYVDSCESVVVNSTSTARLQVRLPQPMRVAPSISIGVGRGEVYSGISRLTIINTTYASSSTGSNVTSATITATVDTSTATMVTGRSGLLSATSSVKFDYHFDSEIPL